MHVLHTIGFFDYCIVYMSLGSIEKKKRHNFRMVWQFVPYKAYEKLRVCRRTALDCLHRMQKKRDSIAYRLHPIEVYRIIRVKSSRGNVFSKLNSYFYVIIVISKDKNTIFLMRSRTLSHSVNEPDPCRRSLTSGKYYIKYRYLWTRIKVYERFVSIMFLYTSN